MLIKNKTDWENLVRLAYPNFVVKIYPKEYPCLGKSTGKSADDYIGAHNSYDHRKEVCFYAAYFPKTRSPKKAYIACLSNPYYGWQLLFTA